MINEKIQTTANGYEITHSSEQMDAQDFRERMASEYGITGDSPRERIEQLQNLSVEGVSIMWTDINKSLQGSRDSLKNRERVMKIGDTETIPLEDRYAVFSHLVESIKDAPKDTSPERIADAPTSWVL